MSASINNLDQSINCDDIEELISSDDDNHQINTESQITITSLKLRDERLVTQQSSLPSRITQVQNVSLSLEKSLANIEENSEEENNQKSKILTVKTSSVPGPVGLLPILKTHEDLKRLKEDKSARDAVLTNEESVNAKRNKTTADLFSLNIDNYPSYTIALKQLHESFSCEPISIHTALVKTRLGIKKRIPLMCAAVTHYDRQENTILLDKSGHIRATFIGDDELLDNFNIRVGHTLVLRNVAVFTSTRHRHHYVHIHLQNIIAIQDPLSDFFSMPLMSEEQQAQKSILCSIENEISAYEDTTKLNNETFHIFSQSDHDDDEQPPLKKPNTNLKSSNNSAFNHIKPLASSVNKFKETLGQKPQSTSNSSIQPQKQISSISNVNIPITITPPSSVAEVDLLKMIDKPIDADLNAEAMKNMISDIDNDDFFSTW